MEFYLANLIVFWSIAVLYRNPINAAYLTAKLFLIAGLSVAGILRLLYGWDRVEAWHGALWVSPVVIWIAVIGYMFNDHRSSKP